MEQLKYEEWPLQGPHASFSHSRSPRFKGPLRVVKLCVLGIAIPSALISVPLYMRYHVYVNQVYPFAVSDMRVLDGRISTVWCQKQLVKVNTTSAFNAYLMPDLPRVSPDQKTISMTRDLLLEDDMKEYWGFYLLSGTSVTVSTCARWPGASLVVIRGHKHLHECAYIGDDSSEELDELLKMAKEQLFGGNRTKTTLDASSSSISVANAPKFMQRHEPGVQFHHHSTNGTFADDVRHQVESTDITDPALMKNILEVLSQKTEKQRQRQKQLESKFRREMNETRENSTRSEEAVLQEVLEKLEGLEEGKRSVVLEKLYKRVNRTKREILLKTARELNQNDEERNAALEEPDGIADVRGSVNETTDNDRSNSEFWSSFSSSEEILLNCEGLILNLPLSPHHDCEASREDKFSGAAETNTITYRVPSNGYYFFVFGSENEVQVNYVKVRFHLNKTVYDVSHPVKTCPNATEKCELDLGFFSSQKTVMELPMRPNETRWNDEFVVISECEPRTAIYVCCVLAVPILVLFFAFQ